MNPSDSDYQPINRLRTLCLSETELAQFRESTPEQLRQYVLRQQKAIEVLKERLALSNRERDFYREMYEGFRPDVLE